MLLTSISRGWPRVGGRKVLPSVALVGTILLALSYTRTSLSSEILPENPLLHNTGGINLDAASQAAHRIREAAAGGHNAVVSGRNVSQDTAFVDNVNLYNTNDFSENSIEYKGNEESPAIVLDGVDVTTYSSKVSLREGSPPASVAMLSASSELEVRRGFVISSAMSPSSRRQGFTDKNSSRILKQMVLDASHRKRTLWASEKTCGLYNVMFAMPGAMPLCALASYPGSGNTWTRYLIEAASGIFTGSIYKDQQLYMSGYYGELMDWKSGATIVQKTHDCGENHIKDFGSCGVLLLRNPYRAILSFHNYLFGGHTGYAKISNYRRKDWPKFVHLQARHWLEIAVNWTNKAQNLHVVHYENLKEDSSNSLKDILKFRSLVTDERRLNCIKKHKKFKYHRKEEYLPNHLEIFSPKLRDMIDRAIRYVDYILQKRGLHPLPLHLYEYYNGTSSKQITLINCSEGEIVSQCDERIDQMNLTNKSKKIPKKGKSETAKTVGKIKVYKYGDKAEDNNGEELKESYAPTGIEKFAATKVGGAITSLGVKVINFFAEDPIKAELKRGKGIMNPKMELDREFGNGDANKLNNDFLQY